METDGDSKYSLGNPKVILVLSGKRKSGKDYVASKLLERIGCDICVVIRLSGPLKKQYAEANNLNFQKLLDASNYKEQHRLEMIQWSEGIRKEDSGFFCREAIRAADIEGKHVWIISDARRKTDIEFFITSFPSKVILIRVYASPEIRKLRGWKFTEGIDNCASECGLDDFTDWDVEICNDTDEHLSDGLNMLMAMINNRY